VSVTLEELNNIFFVIWLLNTLITFLIFVWTIIIYFIHYSSLVNSCDVIANLTFFIAVFIFTIVYIIEYIFRYQWVRINFIATVLWPICFINVFNASLTKWLLYLIRIHNEWTLTTTSTALERWCEQNVSSHEWLSVSSMRCHYWAIELIFYLLNETWLYYISTIYCNIFIHLFIYVVEILTVCKALFKRH
jgi:hypothetical protein